MSGYEHGKLVGKSIGYGAGYQEGYKTGRSDVIAELERCKGKQFDPKITDTFIEMLRTGFSPSRSILASQSDDIVPTSFQYPSNEYAIIFSFAASIAGMMFLPKSLLDSVSCASAIR